LKIENSVFNIQKLDSTESTNKYCEALDLSQVGDFTCYWALEQTAGIGQRGNHWHSSSGKNLTFSLVLHPIFLPADRQFKLTQALSLALVDFLSTLNFKLSVSIKWPNDIYVDGKKICGTLVSTRLQGTAIASAVCGIGLNINEREFPSWIPHPTSLSILTRQEYDLETMLRQLLACIEHRYKSLKSGGDPEPEYLAHLMNLHKSARYIYNIQEITVSITGVDTHGRLLLTTTDGQRLSCGMKEISFLI
jgi:BirA family biotin operon repressor/biotin-[acetyl-CoA-carboxylase] ligase